MVSINVVQRLGGFSYEGPPGTLIARMGHSFDEAEENNAKGFSPSVLPSETLCSGISGIKGGCGWVDAIASSKL
jgi:hypothetical protein